MRGGFGSLLEGGQGRLATSKMGDLTRPPLRLVTAIASRSHSREQKGRVSRKNRPSDICYCVDYSQLVAYLFDVSFDIVDDGLACVMEEAVGRAAIWTGEGVDG